MKKKIEMKEVKLNFWEGFKEFIDYCKRNNYRPDTIRHYTCGFDELSNFLDQRTLLADINQPMIDDVISQIMKKDCTDTTKYINVKDLKRFLNYFMEQGYLTFVPDIKNPKTSTAKKETYTDDELIKLLKKPDMRKCSFTVYKTWVIENFLLSTGVRLSSLINIKNEDLDLDSGILRVAHTKNRKPLLIPLSNSIQAILKEYVRIREGNKQDYLFCNITGDKLSKVALTNAIVRYNQSRGVNSRGVHKFRHTFAKQFILSGGNVAALSKILGHSNLSVTDRYINLLVSDVASEVNKIDVLNKYSRKSIKLK